MKAIVQDRYGSPDALRLEEIDTPVVTDDSVLIRVRAASVNAADWHVMRGEPLIARAAFGLRRPKQRIRGTDVAGTVEAVGKAVTEFHPGDEVFGSCRGSLAEYACADPNLLVAKPAGLSFEQAAAVPLAALTALQGLRDQGHVQAGQKVLVNGASGAVGPFAVQIAKSFGAEVTGVCSSPNVEMARSIGADRVVDYTKEDFTEGEDRYDVLVDVAGTRPWSRLRRVLRPQGTLVVIGGPSTNRLWGPLGHLAGMRLASLRDGRKVAIFVASTNHDDLVVLKEMLEARKILPVIDRTYSLTEAPEAIRYLEIGHARGKVVITV